MILQKERIRCPYGFVDIGKDLILAYDETMEEAVENELKKEEKYTEKKTRPVKYSCRPLYGIVYNNHISEITDEHDRKSLSARSRDKKINSSCANTEKKGKQSKEEEDEWEKEWLEEYWATKVKQYMEYNGWLKHNPGCAKFSLWSNSVEKIVQDMLELNKKVEDNWFILKDIDEGESLKSLDPAVLEKVLLEIVKKTRAVPIVKTCTSKRSRRHTIEKIIFPNTNNDIFIENIMEKRIEMCKALEISFKNQSMSIIGKGFLDKMLPRFRPSMMSEELLDIVDSKEGKPKIFFGKMYDEVPEDEVIGFDMLKCYRKSALTMPYDYAVSSVFDTREPYDEKKSKGGSAPGLYFITTDNQIPFNGGGWFLPASIQFAKEQKIDFTIHSMILTSECLPNNYLVSTINEIVA